MNLLHAPVSFALLRQAFDQLAALLDPRRSRNRAAPGLTSFHRLQLNPAERLRPAHLIIAA